MLMNKKNNFILAVLNSLKEGSVFEYIHNKDSIKLSLSDVNKVLYNEYNNMTTLNSPFVSSKYIGYATDFGILVTFEREGYGDKGIAIKLFNSKEDIKDFLVNDINFLDTTGLIKGAVAESLHAVNLIDKNYDDSFSIVRVVDELIDLRAKKVKIN